ncbi:MAG: helix-turn-helix domain-containing protein [Candidatus Anaerobiospirillum merdipullorum]|uniref:Helix-turn-helix domain-containing protein n=1 Tax=Candidatus Anaerobiospirillum merdipullorum TaxID=2838450 RepID=A0A9E2NUB0_9GAMM|nr:helix-turn-helix domain-containing protein [Candidatus Anaerobiospirillum merdipullorum]
MPEQDLQDWFAPFIQPRSSAVLEPVQLEHYIKLIIQMLHIQVHCYKADGTLVLKLAYSVVDGAGDPLQSDAAFLQSLMQQAKQDSVFIVSDHGPIVYGGVLVNEQIIIFGPVIIGVPQDDIAKLHGLRHNCAPPSLTKGDVPSFCSALLLLHSIFNKEDLSLNAFIARSFLNATILKSLSRKISDITALNIEGQPHHPLSMETRVLENIRLGDPDRLMQSLDYPYPGRRGTLATDILRSEKNIGIIDVTLSARAAISGGLGVERAYVVADAFILQVEDAKTPQEVFAIKTAAQLRFAQLVKENKGQAEDYLKLNQPPVAHDEVVQATDNDTEVIERQNKIVMTIKNYVQRSIHSKLTIESISNELKLSKSYMQRIFREREHISLMRYCRREKIKVAEQLLCDSDYSIAEITEMLSFCSQSHFTQCFKKEVGVTPDIFRLKHKVTI